MISVYCGLMGAGKSLWAMHALRAALENDSCVVTNIPIIWTELREHLKKRGGNSYMRLKWRLRLLDDEETYEFWRYRGCAEVRERGKLVGWEWITLPRRPDWEDKSRIQLTTLDWGRAREGGKVVYIIDEVSAFFNAKNHMRLSLDAPFYASQHRGLGDEVILIAQSVENIDAQFRRLIQKFVYLTNHTYLKFWFIFKRPAKHTWSVYLRPYSGQETHKPSEFGYFTRDPSLSKCYDTSVKVGIPGHGEPEQPPARTGLPAGALVVFIGLAALALVLGAWWVKEKLTHMTNKPATVVTNGTPALMSRGQSLAQVIAGVQKEEMSRTNVDTGQNKTVDRPKIYCTGIGSLGNEVRVWLSDGRSFWTGDGHLQRVNQADVWIDGVSYPIGAGENLARSQGQTLPVVSNPTLTRGSGARGPVQVGGQGPRW